MASRAFYKKSDSDNDNLATPRELAKTLVDRFQLTLDVAASQEDTVTHVFFDEAANGLSKRWSPHRIWMNPPYSQVGHWVAKAHEEADNGALVVGLLPAWTDRKWFHQHILNRAEIVFISGRLRFLDPATMKPMKWAARFASMIVVWHPLPAPEHTSPTPPEPIK